MSPRIKLNPANRIRLVTFDGGGIYGYCTAIMLRNLCHRLPNFLARGCTDIFAGTSIGALISLLLAKEEEPRRFIMSGELEALFFNENLYSNKQDPLNRMLSLYGMTAWSGGADMDKIMDQYFGNMRMGDLKQRVLITTFAMGAHKGPNTWETRIWRNFPSDKITIVDENKLVRDVAYGAVSPSTLRPIRGFLTDGGMTAMSPAISALAEIVDKPPELVSLEDAAKKLRNRTRTLLKDYYEGTISLDEVIKEVPALLKGWQHLLEAGYESGYDPTDYQNLLLKLSQLLEKVDSPGSEDDSDTMGSASDETLHLISQIAETTRYRYDRLNLLRKIELFSVGVGSRVPGYHAADYNYGIVPFSLLPTNILQAFFTPPFMQLMYDPNTKYISTTAGRLLGDADRFFRLDPEVIGFPVPPVIPATYLARIPSCRRLYLRAIEEQSSLIPPEVYENAVTWLLERGWNDAQLMHTAQNQQANNEAPHES
ncbi:patatin-like phospholipase family protein [Acanthopleuribacter pedis]|uniref:Patatin-like phospholipase family protein n=1 Tax=Acanthopleuribacter pedis TaxID=442870 RepID=A0A8J7U2I3_9BACT|nr:patatin-like phospholipase family protein [Acanthopleuribacter pedis]MBO1319353.1 patatin-like phospholipase family protein [Acanthopleuribacter pedis]